jgi:hypothetical protein
VRKAILFVVLIVSTNVLVVLSSYWDRGVIALPPPEDTPEEILRTEIITAARSPIDGKLLSAAEYAQLQAQLQQRRSPTLAIPLQEQIFLLRLRNALLQIFPFLDI